MTTHDKNRTLKLSLAVASFGIALGMTPSSIDAKPVAKTEAEAKHKDKIKSSEDQIHIKVDSATAKQNRAEPTEHIKKSMKN
jgi:hypothetical protein